VHDAGALFYMDGANLNALIGMVKPGDFGVDLMHLNFHKTFSTPHGGGGPGAGGRNGRGHRAPFLPVPTVKKDGEKYVSDFGDGRSIGKVKAFFGNTGILVRAYAYMLAHSAGAGRNAVCSILNANTCGLLKDLYAVLQRAPCTNAC
jgi:glycine dehydrogenase subunit 2